ncbi:hypothetical protein Y032_0178g663 [Ancylostoma ceylanicum]|uniref:Uncharacterized protein n=1 Tax=Ancylostoma ceylanicum TaxID=53326 RepID=A0A016STG9_9BILA|nr:hypothetical protein Y032_0178g663 [Ancylostoma ceylanicum]
MALTLESVDLLLQLLHGTLSEFCTGFGLKNHGAIKAEEIYSWAGVVPMPWDALRTAQGLHLAFLDEKRREGAGFIASGIVA